MDTCIVYNIVYDWVCMCLDSDGDTSERSVDEDTLRSTLEELTEVQFQFEVKAVHAASSLQHSLSIALSSGFSFP